MTVNCCDSPYIEHSKTGPQQHVPHCTLWRVSHLN